jgi:hypothetical protein
MYTHSSLPLQIWTQPGPWGEERYFPFTQSGLADQTRYFFAARLKLASVV